MNAHPARGPAQDIGRRLYSMEETMRRLGDVSRRQVYRLVADGHLKLVRIGKRPKIDADLFDAYIEDLPAVPVRAEGARHRPAP